MLISPHGAKGRLFNITRKLYSDFKFRIQTKAGASEIFHPETCVLPGGSLFPPPLILYFSDLTFRPNAVDVTLGNRPTLGTQQADDNLVIVVTPSGLQQRIIDMRASGAPHSAQHTL